MKKYFYILILFLFLCGQAYTFAQIPISNIGLEEDSEDDEDEPDSATVIPADFTSSLDYVLNSWAVDKNDNSNCKSLPNPFVTEEQYRIRLQKLPYEIEMPYNSAVKSFIEIYTQKNRTQLEYMLGLKEYYFPIFEEALEAKRLPQELKYLPIIESALNPTAVSRAGASGLWQFMIGTGRMYGLEVNTLVDERLDPVKSSKVAATYLKELYSIYSDWHLVIAAYNCGPGNVNKAIRRANGKHDFWAIYPYLPAETRAYVPIFIAASYSMNYSDEHNLCPKKVRILALTDTIMVNKRIHFQQMAAVLNMPVEQIRIYNPQYRRDIVPGDIKPYPVCLPLNYANLLIDKMDDVLLYKADELVNNRRSETEILEVKNVFRRNGENHNGRVTHHKVKKGQTLSGIAKKYHVSVSKLRKLNGLGKKSKIKSGQRLKIIR